MLVSSWAYSVLDIDLSSNRVMSRVAFTEKDTLPSIAAAAIEVSTVRNHDGITMSPESVIALRVSWREAAGPKTLSLAGP